MTSLKWSKGVHYVTFDLGGEKFTEEFRKLSTALKFAKSIYTYRIRSGRI